MQFSAYRLIDLEYWTLPSATQYFYTKRKEGLHSAREFIGLVVISWNKELKINDDNNNKQIKKNKKCK